MTALSVLTLLQREHSIVLHFADRDDLVLCVHEKGFMEVFYQSAKLLQNYCQTIAKLLQNYCNIITKLLQNYCKLLQNIYVKEEWVTLSFEHY